MVAMLPWVDWGCTLGFFIRVINILAVLKNIFNFILGPPSPRGVPGGRPDCQLPTKIGGLGADSGPDPGGILFLLSISALSAAGMYGPSRA